MSVGSKFPTSVRDIAKSSDVDRNNLRIGPVTLSSVSLLPRLVTLDSQGRAKSLQAGSFSLSSWSIESSWVISPLGTGGHLP